MLVRAMKVCFPLFQRKTLNVCVDCLTGEVRSAILIFVQNQCDPSGMKPLPPRNFGVEVGRGLDECVGPVPFSRSEEAGLSVLLSLDTESTKSLLQRVILASGSGSVWKGPCDVSG